MSLLMIIVITISSVDPIRFLKISPCWLRTLAPSHKGEQAVSPCISIQGPPRRDSHSWPRAECTHSPCAHAHKDFFRDESRPLHTHLRLSHSLLLLSAVQLRLQPFDSAPDLMDQRLPGCGRRGVLLPVTWHLCRRVQPHTSRPSARYRLP